MSLSIPSIPSFASPFFSGNENRTPLINNKADTSQATQNYGSTANTSSADAGELQNKAGCIQALNSEFFFDVNKCMVFVMFFIVSTAQISIPNHIERSQSPYVNLAVLGTTLTMTTLLCASVILAYRETTR